MLEGNTGVDHLYMNSLRTLYFSIKILKFYTLWTKYELIIYNRSTIPVNLANTHLALL